MWRLMRGECLEGYCGKFELDTVFDGKPMELRQQAGGGTARMASEDNTSQRILNSLELG
jgi:hypothetical protein